MAVGAGHIRLGTPWPPSGPAEGSNPLPAISISHNSPITIIILIKRQPHPFSAGEAVVLYVFSCFYIFPIIDHAVQPLAHKDKPGQSRGAQGQRASRNTPPTPATVILPQMAQCSGVNGMQTPHKICKPTHKITNVQIVPTMSDGMSNA